jgi:hypothetical protein
MLGVPEPTAIAFLDFTGGPDSKFYKILSLRDEKERRRRFRSAYVWHGFGRHLFAYGLVTIGEITPNGKPPPLAVRLEKALPFQR